MYRKLLRDAAHERSHSKKVKQETPTGTFFFHAKRLGVGVDSLVGD
jgi:hypothetical protein